MKDTRLEKLSFTEVCVLDEGCTGAVANGDDRLEVGGVGRKAAKADEGTPYGCVFVAPSGLVVQSSEERSSITDYLLLLAKTHASPGTRTGIDRLMIPGNFVTLLRYKQRDRWDLRSRSATSGSHSRLLYY